MAKGDILNVIGPEIRESVTYNGYTSRNGSGHVLLANLSKNTSNSLITVTNTDHTRYTFNDSCSVVITASIGGAAAVATRIYIYNSSNVEQITSKATTATSGWGNSATTYEVSPGDYAVFYTAAGLDNNSGTNFSVTATANL